MRRTPAERLQQMGLPPRLALLVLGATALLFVAIYRDGVEERANVLTEMGSGAPASLLATVDRHLQSSLIFVAACGVALAVAVWLLAYFLVSRPARQLSQAQHLLAEGHFGQGGPERLAQPVGGEVGALAGQFEAMSAALEERFADQSISEAKYRSLVENIPAVAYAVIEGGLRSADCAPAEGDDAQLAVPSPQSAFVSPRIQSLLGFTPAEWTADPEPWSRQIHEEDRERVVAEYRHAIEAGLPFRAEYRIRAREGRVLWVLDDARGLPTPEGTQLVCGVMQDITRRKEEELALRTSEQTLSTVLDIAEEAIIAVDDEYNICFFNKRAARLFGYASEEAMGLPLTQLLPSFTIEHIFNEARGEPAPVEMQAQRREGLQFLVELSASEFSIRGKHHLTLVLRDITDGKERETLLMESEAAFRRIFADNPLPMWVYDIDTFQFLEVNNAALTRYGYTREEFLGMHITDLRAPEDVPRLMTTTTDRLYQSSLQTPHSALQWRHRCKDGQIIDVQVTSHALEYQGRSATLVVAEDVTERKRAEDALRESEKRFRAFFEGSALGVAVLDLEGRISKSNPALHAILGFDGEELRRTSFDDLAVSRQEALHFDPYREITDAGDQYQREMRFRRKDGRPVWASVTLSLIRGRKRRAQFYIAMVENITERKRAQEQVKRQLERLAGLRNIDMAISSSLDLRVTLSVILDQVTSQLRVDAASVLLLNPHTQMLEYAAGRGFRYDSIIRSRVRMGEGYAGRAALQRRTLAVPNVSDTGDLTRAPLLAGEDFITYYALPLEAKGQVKGVLEIFHRSQLDPDPEWLDFLQALAGQAAIAIDNATMFNDLQRSNVELALAYDVTLEGWSRALDLRDKETEGHTQRVTEVTMRLARAMGMAEGELVHVHRGALLHDIGKMGIPDSILLKPGPLTEEEWETMRKHPVYAYELLSPISFLRPALEIPYCHHEKWDGTGYPRGLKGEQIPLAARIFSVVDVWDALRSDRPYRKAWPDQEVREYIRSLSGSHFDPRVVRAFLKLDVAGMAPDAQPYGPSNVMQYIEQHMNSGPFPIRPRGMSTAPLKFPEG